MRQTLFFLFCLLLSLCPGNRLLGQEADSTFHSLRVIVDGISKTEGTLVVGVVDQAHYEKNDMKGFNQKVPVTSQTMELTFDSLQAPRWQSASKQTHVRPSEVPDTAKTYHSHRSEQSIEVGRID